MIDLRFVFTVLAAGLTGGPFETDQLPTSHVAVESVTDPAPALELVQYVAGEQAFHVTAVLIAGPTEALLIDTQYHVGDARRLADRIAATGRRLKAIFITHPDHDHFAGAAAIVERFPGTPVYMTAAAIHHFDSVGVRDFQADRDRRPVLFADSVVAPEELPATTLTVDGIPIEIVPDLQGDVLAPVNSAVWIPSSRTLITGDLVFSGVHVWLAASSPTTRGAWREDLRSLAALGPVAVVPGHKPSVDTPDSPDALQTMIAYLAAFDALRETAEDGSALAAAMKTRYPWAVEGLLNYSARMAYR